MKTHDLTSKAEPCWLVFLALLSAALLIDAFVFDCVYGMRLGLG